MQNKNDGQHDKLFLQISSCQTYFPSYILHACAKLLHCRARENMSRQQQVLQQTLEQCNTLGSSCGSGQEKLASADAPVLHCGAALRAAVQHTEEAMEQHRAALQGTKVTVGKKGFIY
jgi:hypothetical protein